MRVTPSRGGGLVLGGSARRRTPASPAAAPGFRVRRVWPWVFVAQWAGGTTLLLLLAAASAVGLAPQDLPGDAVFAPWPVSSVGSAVVATAWGVVVSITIAGILGGLLTLRRPPTIWALGGAVAAGGYVPLALVHGLSRGDADGSAGCAAVVLTSVLVRLVARRADGLPRAPRARRRTVALVLAGAMVLVVPWAVFHPLQAGALDLMDRDGGSSSVDAPTTTTVGPGERVRIGVTVQTAAPVELLDVRLAVPGGLRVVRTGRTEPTSALPRTLRRDDFQSPTFALVAVGCPSRPARVDALRVRYVRLGRTISQRLPLRAPLSIRCRRGAGPIR